MTTKKNTPDTQNAAFIGIDLGDTKHAICITDQLGKIIAEYSIPNNRKQIEKLVQLPPNTLASSSLWKWEHTALGSAAYSRNTATKSSLLMPGSSEPSTPTNAKAIC